MRLALAFAVLSLCSCTLFQSTCPPVPPGQVCKEREGKMCCETPDGECLLMQCREKNGEWAIVQRTCTPSCQNNDGTPCPL